MTTTDIKLTSMKKEEVRRHIVFLYEDYLGSLDEWNQKASQYGGHKNPSFESFMDWMNENYIK